MQLWRLKRFFLSSDSIETVTQLTVALGDRGCFIEHVQAF
jgi:hypothetical protein